MTSMLDKEGLAKAAMAIMQDHVERFWRILETEHVRILVDMQRDTSVPYWDSSSFPDDVAKALVQERREPAALRAGGEPVQVKPVAWLRVEQSVQEALPGRRDVTADPEAAEMWRLSEYTASLTPLYAHPAPSSLERQLAEALAELEKAKRVEAAADSTYSHWRDRAQKAEAERDALAADKARPTHRHKKRGTEYVLIGIGKMQAGSWNEFEEGYNRGSVDMREVAICRSADDGSLWARPRVEFEDGRFEAIHAARPTSIPAPNKAEARREALEEAAARATWGRWERAQQEKERGK